jgi:hypothetical protein
LNHVAAIVGGFNTQQKNIGQQGVAFNPIPKAHQMEAVRFLNDNAFASPTWQVDKDVVRRFEPIGVLSRIRNAQNSVLNNLLSSARFARLVEQNVLDGDQSYAPADFLADVRRGVWRELETPQVRIDPYRRNLQRAYLDIANNKVNGAAPTVPQGLPAGFAAQFVTSGDEKPFYRAELRSLNNSITVALARTTDRATRVHLESVRDQIARILDPKFAPPTTGNTGPTIIFGVNEFDGFSMTSDSCWPDYVIRP